MKIFFSIIFAAGMARIALRGGHILSHPGHDPAAWRPWFPVMEAGMWKYLSMA
ncbi:hypothetical protein [Komagataeibacter swingsii]|uniref:Uncharacterized protein n=1 Tax=Komagataeibacter swingsii TaxID=215220 RepID=A0A850NY16_9PROT|nr:hypothetical protein [Komagataeibacter swingsii]NVN37217.1 hypothetical protein [Komagataeibacter swingsii]